DRDRDRREKPALPAARAREKTEGGAGIVGQHEVEERRDLGRLAHAEGAADPPFGRQVERDRRGTHDEPPQPRAVRAITHEGAPLPVLPGWRRSARRWWRAAARCRRRGASASSARTWCTGSPSRARPAAGPRRLRAPPP